MRSASKRVAELVECSVFASLLPSCYHFSMLKRDNGASIRVVPAIDLLDGRVVRLRQGRYDQVTEYSVEPERVAAALRASRARRCCT